MKKEFFTTMITPYEKDGTISLENVKKYTDWYFKKGLDGIFAICQSSEIFYLSLEERTAINKTVYERAKQLERQSGRRFTVVSSGHVADSLEEQAEELNAVYQSGTDAIILITNRLAKPAEDDKKLITHTEKLMAKLPSEARFGFYECPYPYKRLLSEEVLRWAVSTGKFDFIKDTCCDASLIKKRVEWLRGSNIRLFNANCQTLLESMRDGADGYCGIMCNFHPELYAKMGQLYDSEPEKAEFLQGILGTFGFTENGLPYPLTGKYHMNLCGIRTENMARNRCADELTEYAKNCIRQMKTVTDKLERML